MTRILIPIQRVPLVTAALEFRIRELPGGAQYASKPLLALSHGDGRFACGVLEFRSEMDFDWTMIEIIPREKPKSQCPFLIEIVSGVNNTNVYCDLPAGHSGKHHGRCDSVEVSWDQTK